MKKMHNHPMLVVVVALGVSYHKDDKEGKLLDIVGLASDPRHWLWYHWNRH